MWNRGLITFVLFIWFHLTGFCQQAVFDLRQSKLENEIISLEGEWQFEYGKLLSAEEMQSIDTPFFTSVPHSWGNTTFREADISSNGFASYYARIIIDKNTEDLALRANVVSTNYKIFINGEAVVEVGKVATDQENAEPNYRNEIIPFSASGDTVDVVFHISNFHYRKGGMTKPPAIGKHTSLLEEKGQNIALASFLIGSIFFMGLYHLGSNLFRSRSKMNSYFALVCLFTILRTLSVNEYLLIDYLNFPWWLSTRIELISFYLILATTTRFIYYLFPNFIPAFLAKIPYYFGVSASIITVFSPLLYSSHLVPIMQIVTVLTSVGLLFYMLKATIKGDREAIIASGGFLLLFAVTIIEILIHHSQMVGNTVFALGIFFYLFSHVVILANRQNQTYIKIEDLSTALKSSNARLEHTVQERTRELNERNEELLTNNEELRRIHEEKNGLVHVLAHDLKSPLNNNKGLISLIKMKDNLDSQQKDYLVKLERSNEQGVQLIEDLLQLYKIESKQKPEIEAIAIQPYFDELISKYEDNACLKKINLRKDISTIEADFHSDPEKIHRIMDNLISNALKFSNKDSNVDIIAVQKPNELIIEVKDQGLGILPEEQGKLFKKFQKMSNKPTNGESSSGLGLSIVKTLVEQLKGTIEFQSVPRKGTSFRIQLPDLISIQTA